MTNYRGLLKALCDAQVDFILIGGFAAMAHGSTRFTADVDVVYSRDKSNLQRLTDALAPYAPYPRGVPTGLPFQWDLRTLQTGLNFTLETALGPLDLLAETSGAGTYESLLPDSFLLDIAGMSVRIVSLRRLIALKRAAGRPKDLETVAELEALESEQQS